LSDIAAVIPHALAEPPLLCLRAALQTSYPARPFWRDRQFEWHTLVPLRDQDWIEVLWPLGALPLTIRAFNLTPLPPLDGGVLALQGGGGPLESDRNPRCGPRRTFRLGACFSLHAYAFLWKRAVNCRLL